MKRSLLSLGAILLLVLAFAVPSTYAAAFDEFTVRPSRVESAITNVNFLVKLRPATTATENEIRVTFGTGYTVAATPATITVDTTLATLTNWDAECTNTVPTMGAAANAVAGQAVDFTSGELTVGTTYCFIITAGITNPATPGNYPVTVATLSGTNVVTDDSTMTLPTVDDDEVVITAAVAPFVRCDVDTTSGSNNSINLGTLQYGTVTSSNTMATPDNIRITGGTNAVEGMTWYYRSDASFLGLRSTLGTYTLSGAAAEGTLSGTNLTCSTATPCYGIYYNGSLSSATGSISVDSDYVGLTTTTAVGPMRTDIWGDAIATSTGPASNVQVIFNVNATAAEQAPAATDYTDTLIFTCKADL